jgi:hypothetical protein
MYAGRSPTCSHAAKQLVSRIGCASSLGMLSPCRCGTDCVAGTGGCGGGAEDRSVSEQSATCEKPISRWAMVCVSLVEKMKISDVSWSTRYRLSAKADYPVLQRSSATIVGQNVSTWQTNAEADITHVCFIDCYSVDNLIIGCTIFNAAASDQPFA